MSRENMSAAKAIKPEDDAYVLGVDVKPANEVGGDAAKSKNVADNMLKGAKQFKDESMEAIMEDTKLKPHEKYAKIAALAAERMKEDGGDVSYLKEKMGQGEAMEKMVAVHAAQAAKTAWSGAQWAFGGVGRFARAGFRLALGLAPDAISLTKKAVVGTAKGLYAAGKYVLGGAAMGVVGATALATSPLWGTAAGIEVLRVTKKSRVSTEDVESKFPFLGGHITKLSSKINNFIDNGIQSAADVVGRFQNAVEGAQSVQRIAKREAQLAELAEREKAGLLSGPQAENAALAKRALELEAALEEAMKKVRLEEAYPDMSPRERDAFGEEMARGREEARDARYAKNNVDEEEDRRLSETLDMSKGERDELGEEMAKGREEARDARYAQNVAERETEKKQEALRDLYDMDDEALESLGNEMAEGREQAAIARKLGEVGRDVAEAENLYLEIKDRESKGEESVVNDLKEQFQELTGVEYEEGFDVNAWGVEQMTEELGKEPTMDQVQIALEARAEEAQDEDAYPYLKQTV